MGFQSEVDLSDFCLVRWNGQVFLKKRGKDLQFFGTVLVRT